MPSNKDRLYVALYARAGQPRMPGREDTYHWALIVGPKIEPESEGKGIRFQAQERITISGVPPSSQAVWFYDERSIQLQPTAMLLVRVTVGKIKDKDRLQSILRRIPMRPEVPGWNCVGWVQEAINAILQDGKALGTCAESWTAIRDTAMQYVADKKAAHRFDGRVQHDMKKAATWDMLGGKEAIP